MCQFLPGKHFRRSPNIRRCLDFTVRCDLGCGRIINTDEISLRINVNTLTCVAVLVKGAGGLQGLFNSRLLVYILKRMFNDGPGVNRQPRRIVKHIGEPGYRHILFQGNVDTLSVFPRFIQVAGAVREMRVNAAFPEPEFFSVEISEDISSATSLEFVVASTRKHALVIFGEFNVEFDAFFNKLVAKAAPISG